MTRRLQSIADGQGARITGMPDLEYLGVTIHHPIGGHLVALKGASFRDAVVAGRTRGQYLAEQQRVHDGITGLRQPAIRGRDHNLLGALGKMQLGTRNQTGRRAGLRHQSIPAGRESTHVCAQSCMENSRYPYISQLT